MIFPKALFTAPLETRIRAITVLSVHFFVCVILLIIGGLITEGFRSTGSFAAADVFRYVGYLMSLFLAVILVICLIALRGGLCFAWFVVIEIPAFSLQFIAWIIDAVNAGRLAGTGSRSYDLAIAAAILGFIASMFTLYLAIGLFLQRRALADLCGGAQDCCGADTQDRHVGASRSAAGENTAAQPSGKDSV